MAVSEFLEDLVSHLPAVQLMQQVGDPVCIEGERACPPEDVGGVGDYAEYLEVLADEDDDRHEEMLRWRGNFDPEKFDAGKATKLMQRGLRNWRLNR